MGQKADNGTGPFNEKTGQTEVSRMMIADKRTCPV
jgi:hypothetical protein